MPNITDMINDNPQLRPFMDIVDTIMNMPEENLSESTVESIQGMINGAVTPRLKNDGVKNLHEAFTDQGYSKLVASNFVAAAKDDFNEFIDNLNPSEQKRKLLNNIFKPLYEIFDTAIETYHTYNFLLPMTLEEGAHEPTYAHDTDAAADLYAADTVVAPAHSISNMIRTGVHIALPEGWVALIWPRSSIGAKTGLRLSNAAGVIDSHYRGQLGVLYDNISDSDYTIHAGDRIAQMIVMPNYHFKAEVVDALDETDRGANGFGSSGV